MMKYFRGFRGRNVWDALFFPKLGWGVGLDSGGCVKIGGGPCDFSVSPSPNWILIWDCFGFGSGSMET